MEEEWDALGAKIESMRVDPKGKREGRGGFRGATKGWAARKAQSEDEVARLRFSGTYRDDAGKLIFWGMEETPAQRFQREARERRAAEEELERKQARA